MPELRNWKDALVIQRDLELGCIPTGYEWMLRVSRVQGADLDNFQEEFNLQAQGREKNSFESVGKAVKEKYPHLKIKWKDFERGSDKVEFIESLIKSNIPCLISLALQSQGGWHIMPIMYIDDQKLKLITSVDQSHNARICEIERTEVIRRHDNWPGGKDVAWLEVEECK